MPRLLGLTSARTATRSPPRGGPEISLCWRAPGAFPGTNQWPAPADVSMGQSRKHRVDDEREQDEPGAEEEKTNALRDFFAALPVILDAIVVKPAGRDKAVIPALPLVKHLVFEMRPEKITVSIGNFSMRKCVLKKWKVKMKPAASSASSDCTSSAMLMIQPGRNPVKNFGNHMIRPETPMAKMPQNTAK